MGVFAQLQNLPGIFLLLNEAENISFVLSIILLRTIESLSFLNHSHKVIENIHQSLSSYISYGGALHISIVGYGVSTGIDHCTTFI